MTARACARGCAILSEIINFFDFFQNFARSCAKNEISKKKFFYNRPLTRHIMSKNAMNNVANQLPSAETINVDPNQLPKLTSPPINSIFPLEIFLFMLRNYFF